MYLDADIIYAYIKPSDWLKKYSKNIMDLEDLKTSIITIIELEIVAKRDFQDDFYNKVLDEIRKIKALKIINLSTEILEKAIELRRNQGLNIFDSIHAATAILSREEIIVSSDSAFDNVVEIKRKDPRTYD